MEIIIILNNTAKKKEKCGYIIESKICVDKNDENLLISKLFSYPNLITREELARRGKPAVFFFLFQPYQLH